jgi:hypothetical protein
MSNSDSYTRSATGIGLDEPLGPHCHPFRQMPDSSGVRHGLAPMKLPSPHWRSMAAMRSALFTGVSGA